MDIYKDWFCVIRVNEKENYAMYADMYMGFFIMSIPIAKYIAARLKENVKYGCHLLDLAKQIFKEKGVTV